MKYYPILFLLFVVYSSCTLSNKTDVTKSVADSTIVVLDSDVIAQIEEDKRLEKYFNQVIDPICDIIYKHNSFDYVPINNKTIAWFKKCKQDLIFFYDSNHPASQLSDNAKVDSFVTRCLTLCDAVALTHSRILPLSLERLPLIIS